MAKELELYIHIPFCVSKCRYCDFLSAPADEEERERYVESLCSRIRSCKEFAKDWHVSSIFVGGGTPSLLTGEQMGYIFRDIRETFRVDDMAEITVEMNPGTVSEEKLKAYREAGINRLSIGLQSANDQELKCLGRIHTYEMFVHSYQMARDCGFSNINVDLMSAIPFQTPESYEKTLRTVAELVPPPEHISAYSLIIEEGTPFYERYGEGKHAEELPAEEEEREMYVRTKEVLEEYGYIRYEISNYAKSGFACRHNLGYWNRTQYLVIMPVASSLIGNKRWREGEEPEILTEKEEMEEFMFLGLRKMEGVSETDFRNVFQKEMQEVYGLILQKMKEEGLMEQAGDNWRLTERGIDISNYVMSEFLF